MVAKVCQYNNYGFCKYKGHLAPSLWNCISLSLVDTNTYPYHVSISIVPFPIKPSVVEAAKGKEMVNTSSDVFFSNSIKLDF